MKYKFIIILFISQLFINLNIVNAQCITPTLTEGVNHISKYITSENYDSLKMTNNDITLIDSIYLSALRFYNFDYSETLLALTIACLPVSKFNITIPLLNIPISLKLPSSTIVDNNKKLANLPKQFIIGKKRNDVDKLSHFFGNAFWSYNLKSSKFSTILGYCIEYFESIFKVDGALDKRDIQVNQFGEQFGIILNYDKTVLPSYYFNKINNLTEEK